MKKIKLARVIHYKVILVICTLLFSLSEVLPQQKTISITDFGYVPGSRRNVIPAVNEALKQCKKEESVTLVFPKGRYDFWQDLSAANTGKSDRNWAGSTTGIDMENLKNIVLDGDGSEFIFHGNMQIMNLYKCENIVLKNFSADWEDPFMYEGNYMNVTDDFIDVQFDKIQCPYVIEDNRFYLTGYGWKSKPSEGYFTLYDKDTKDILYKTHDDNNKHMFTGQAEELASGTVRFYGTPTVKPVKGTYTVLMAGRYITHGIVISDCKDIYLKDITIYYALSSGVFASRSENITFDNANIKANEKKGRLVSVLGDAFHLANCRGLIKVINCAHTGMMDDFINVRGRYSKIDSIVDNNTIIASSPWGDPVPAGSGDEIWFINAILNQRSVAFHIQSVERLGKSTKITFASAIPKAVKQGDYLENKTWAPSVEIRNCSILKTHRARGILVTTPEKVIIEDNYFKSAGTAILIEGDVDYWFESGAHRNLTIRNNVFDNCLTSGCITGSRWEWGEAIISITPSHRPQDDKTEPYHQNIRIENNIFKTFDVPIVHARSVRGLTFKNNEIIRTYAFEPYLWQKSSFLMDGCRDVKIAGNKIHNEYFTRTIETQHMKKSDIKAEGFSLILK